MPRHIRRCFVKPPDRDWRPDGGQLTSMRIGRRVTKLSPRAAMAGETTVNHGAFADSGLMPPIRCAAPD
jgi:hypothetical protein